MIPKTPAIQIVLQKQTMAALPTVNMSSIPNSMGDISLKTSTTIYIHIGHVQTKIWRGFADLMKPSDLDNRVALVAPILTTFAKVIMSTRASEKRVLNAPDESMPISASPTQIPEMTSGMTVSSSSNHACHVCLRSDPEESTSFPVRFDILRAFPRRSPSVRAG